MDAVLKGTPHRPLYWVGVSNGGVPAAACAELYGGASLMLLSAMPANISRRLVCLYSSH